MGTRPLRRLKDGGAHDGTGATEPSTRVPRKILRSRGCPLRSTRSGVPKEGLKFQRKMKPAAVHRGGDPMAARTARIVSRICSRSNRTRGLADAQDCRRQTDEGKQCHQPERH